MESASWQYAADVFGIWLPSHLPNKGNSVELPAARDL